MDWFLRYDSKLSDLRVHFPSKVDEARQEFVSDLVINGRTANALTTQLSNVQRFYFDLVLPGAVLRRQRGGPIPGETR